MTSLLPNHPPLKEFLEGLNHLFIDIARLKPEPGYEEKRGGYCDLQVAILDHETPSASILVAAKKLLLGTRSSDPKRLAFRLARELKVWAGLSHPHVLPLLGFYLANNFKTAVLISEYMAYGDLKDYIARMEPSYDERLRLVRDLTDGLAYLHTRSAPVRHGDLKPGNVLVNPQRRALLADFGLSKALDTGHTGFTTGNDARGTVRFSSPEVLLQGVAAQSLANDIWSWGCLVLEAMTDKAPFAGILPEPQLILAVVQGRSPCDGEQPDLRPPQFKDLLAKCWTIQTDQRPTAADCLGVVQYALLSLTPATITRAVIEQIDHEKLQLLDDNSRAAEQQHPPPEQTPTPPPATQPSQGLQAPLQLNQPLHLGPYIMSMGLYAFFTRVFGDWLKHQQLTLDPPCIDGETVEVPNLFLIVGALGGQRVVSKKMLWRIVATGLRFFSFVGPMPSPGPQVAEQLFKFYEKFLSEFEAHWQLSLKPCDPNSCFPLPRQLQHLHPVIETFATTLVLWRQEQEQGQLPRLLDEGLQQLVGRNEMGTQRPGLGVGIPSGQVELQRFTGSPWGSITVPAKAGSYLSPRTLRMGPPQELRNHREEQGQHPQHEGFHANGPLTERSGMVNGMKPNEASIQAARQFLPACRRNRQLGALGIQVEGGRQPGSSRTRGPSTPPGGQARSSIRTEDPPHPGGQGSPFTVPIAGPSSEFDLSPKMVEQAMRTVGFVDRTQDSLNSEKRNNLQAFFGTPMHPQRQLGMTRRLASGENPATRAFQPGPPGPQGRMPGPNLPQRQHFPAAREMINQPDQQIIKRPRSPGMDISTNEPFPERKRPRKDGRNSVGPTPSFSPKAPGAIGMSAQQPMPKGAANSGTMRLSSQGNLGQTMNPTMVNEGSPRLGANPIRTGGPLRPGPQRFVPPAQHKPGGLVFNSYTNGLPILIGSQPRNMAFQQEFSNLSSRRLQLKTQLSPHTINAEVPGPIPPPSPNPNLYHASNADFKKEPSEDRVVKSPLIRKATTRSPHTPFLNPGIQPIVHNTNIDTSIFNSTVAPSPSAILASPGNNINHSASLNNASGPSSSANLQSTVMAKADPFNFPGPERYVEADLAAGLSDQHGFVFDLSGTEDDKILDEMREFFGLSDLN